MVVVRPTGGGKSLVYQVAGYLMKGITLFISPLLALASDQIRKLRMITRNRPDFVSLHLDDMEESSLLELAHDISTWKEPDGTECAISVIIFASPQLLVGSKGIPIMNILLDMNKSILSMTVMDEVHIASQFGNTFRSEFKMLKRKFYSQLPACCSVNIFMTGTCTLAIVRNFETLFGVKINCTHWPKHNDMRHRSVGIKVKYTSAPMNDIKKVIDATMKGDWASQSRKIIIYSNMRDKIVQLGKKVEDYLEIDEATYPIDLVILHGHPNCLQALSHSDFRLSLDLLLASKFQT